MRYIFAFVLVGLVGVGCGNKGNGGDDMGLDDMAMSGDDMAMSGGDGGGTNCDVLNQTGCQPGQKCTPSVSGMNVVGKCQTAGTKMDGDSCTPGMMGAADDCGAGLRCSRTGQPMGMAVCRKYCSGDSSCSGNQKCAALLGGAVSYGTCAPTCTPFGSDCPANMDCSAPFQDVSSTMTVLNAYLACKTTGAGTAYSDCMRSSDCGAGMYCDGQNQWCAPICDNGHACTQPPLDGGGTAVSCMAFDNGGAAGLGICQ
jgi:hypothetical protein